MKGVERKGHHWAWGSGEQTLVLAQGLAWSGSNDIRGSVGEPAGVVEMRVLDSHLS